MKDQLWNKEKEEAVLKQKLEFLTLELEEKKKERKHHDEMQEKLLESLKYQETPSKYKLEMESMK